MGRGRQTNQSISDLADAVSVTNVSAPDMHLRPPEKAALDGAAFHYTLYRALTRFLG
jgi:alpha-1,3-glucan synthase